MLTREGCAARRDRLWQRLNPKPDALVIADPQHLAYLANYYQPPFTFRVNDAGAILLLFPDGKTVLVADNLLEPFAKQAHADEIITPIWYRSVESALHREGFLVKNTAEQLAKRLGQGAARIGVEAAMTPHGLLAAFPSRKFEVVNLDPHLWEMKRRKDTDEIAVLKKSMAATAAGFATARAEFQPGMTELEAYNLVCRAAMNQAGEQAWVYGDFVTGLRTAEGGGAPSTRKLEKGDLFILDFSVVLWHYRSDYANTLAIGAEPTSRQREMADTCLAAMRAGEAVVKAGVSGKDVYQAVRSVFAAKHLEERFTHHAGHGLGLGHPEAPYLVPQSNEKLLAGDVITLEPGLYFPNDWGMRFERNYLVTNASYELLSPHRLGLSE